MQAVLLPLVLLLGSVSSEYYHITPSLSVPCPSAFLPSQCLTLSQFLNKFYVSSSSNTTLIFLSGNHSLDTKLSVNNTNAFSITGSSSSERVLIICGYVGVFMFENVSSVHISGLTFYGCTDNRLTSVDHFLLENSSFIGRVGKYGTVLELFNTAARLIRTSFRSNIARKSYNINCLQYQNHGQAQAGGAIVSIKSNVTILHSVFEGNGATVGGAIFHTNCNVTVTNCTINCKSKFVEKIRRKIYHEGALKNLASLQDVTFINISNCEFISNYVIGPRIGGGAMCAIVANVILSQSQFLNNIGHGDGGVVYADITNIFIIDATFITNRAEHYGGVIFVRELANVTIIHSNFINNTALLGGILNIPKGNYYATTTILYSHFSNNSASTGGIITVNIIEDVYTQMKINISHSEFINNFADSHGGVVSIRRDSHVDLISGWHDRGGCTTILNVTQSRFINNKANSGGGVFNLNNCPTYVKIAHSVFIENNGSYSGGVIAILENKWLSITHSVFRSNKAKCAGVMYVRSGPILISQNKFIKNMASSGGVMLIEYIDDANIVDNLFIQNNATTGHGGVMAAYRGSIVKHGFYPSSGVLIIDNNKFMNNSAASGGVLRISEYKVSISYCTFIYNIAKGNGSVLWSDYSSDLKIIGNVFQQNRVLNNGGALYVFKGVLNINSSLFDHNIGKNGGVIYADQTTMEIIESTFESNRAEVDGGTIITKESVLALNESQFHKNSAGNNGGVASLLHTTLNIYASSFTNNLAHCDGGVFSLFKVNTIVSVSNHIQNSASHDGGVIKAYQSTTDISEGCHFDSNSAGNDGGIIQAYQSTTNISESFFTSNSAKNDGGVVSGYQGNLVIYEGGNFMYNTADNDGGVIHSYQLHVLAIGNGFEGNSAKNRGGVSFIYQGSSVLIENIYSYNKAFEGGVVYADQGQIKIENVSCVRNEANEGGVIHMGQTNVTIKHSAFSQNSAISNGGAWFTKSSSVFFEDVYFSDNIAETGGTVHSSKCKVRSIGPMSLYNTTANIGAMYLYGSTAQFSGKTLISNSVGSCLIYDSKVTFWEDTTFTNCSEQITNENPEMLEGGALTLFKSIVDFYGTATFMNNDAKNGGAIQATESKIYVHDVTLIENNSAMKSGGGIHLDMSELNCLLNSSFEVSHNIAVEKGGGIHAIASVVNVNNANITSEVVFIENKSKKGGGIYLESNSKLYIRKSMLYNGSHYAISFDGNSAEHGGAVYVSDDSNSGLCNPNYTLHFDAKECLIQIIADESSEPSLSTTDHQSMKSILFSQNSAEISGASLFGGLIDRCKVLHFTEKLICSSNGNHSTVVDGISYLEDITNIDRSEIGSEPVKICFCNNGVPDCDYHPQTIRIPKGKRFPVSLVAVDQVGHPINATIHSTLRNAGGGFRKGQELQNTTKACTELNFNLVSPYDKEELIMFAQGPCMASPQSQRRLNVHFTACDYCPIGFEQHIEMTVCECVCDSKLEPYITKCNATTEELERVGNFWVTCIKTTDNITSGFVIYPHCPFNYCIPPNSKVQVNLNVPGGENVQCVDGRSGPLCGVCWSNLSLSLGSPRCVPCLSRWPMGLAVILIASFVAGIALVALLLVFNLTVAIGTLNGIIFYANIIAANSSTFLPFSTPNFITIFLSWLNLEIGFDTCFFPGMDAYWKTLLQLAFPMYVIILVIMVIVISERSTRFARLIARKNPVATLATLILFSYTKFLNTVIVSLSFAILHYPDGSDHWLWLPDATIPYLKGKHIALFVISILIILAGIIYTALLLFWQLLLNMKAFMLTKYQKLCHFIEPYHAPYTFEQRYWTGILLLARVLVYVVSSINVSGDPRVALVSTVIIVSSLPVMKAIMERKIYKNWLIGFTETTMHINIIVFTAFTWYTFDAKKNQAVVAYVSIMSTFILLLAVLVYHIFQYTGLLSIVRMIAKKLLAFKNNCTATYGHWHVRIPSNEHSEPLVTESSVEIPKYLESPESTEIELSTSAQYKAPAIKIRSDDVAVSSSMKGSRQEHPSEFHQDGEGDVNI